MSADAPAPLAGAAGSAIPTTAGFYWWRPAKPAAWRMIKVRGVPGFPPHAADDVSANSFFGRPLSGWADDFPVGEWVEVPSPNAVVSDGGTTFAPRPGLPFQP